MSAVNELSHIKYQENVKEEENNSKISKDECSEIAHPMLDKRQPSFINALEAVAFDLSDMGSGKMSKYWIADDLYMIKKAKPFFNETTIINIKLSSFEISKN